MLRTLLAAIGLAAAAAGCGAVREQTAAPVQRMRLLAITSLEPDDSGERMQVRAFIQPAAGYTPLWFRFELYEFVPRDANPRGRRLTLWPDAELSAAESIGRHWRGHLKAYEFVLPVEAALSPQKTYLLEVTAADRDGLRHNDLLKLKQR